MQVPVCVALLYHISFCIGCDSTMLLHSGIHCLLLFVSIFLIEFSNESECLYVSLSLSEQETLHNHKQDNTLDDDSYEITEAAARDSTASTGKTEKHEKASQGPLLKNWPLMSSIIVYCVLCLHDTAYSEVSIRSFIISQSCAFCLNKKIFITWDLTMQIFALWANSPRKYGGLSYSTNDVGTVLAISGMSIICQYLNQSS